MTYRLGRVALAALVATLLLLQMGCAALRNIDSDVSTYGPWPADRKPGSFAFDRLPSQQADPRGLDVLENAARGALLKAGFGPEKVASDAEYLVQLGARVSANDPWPYGDPFWWHGGYHRGWGRFGRFGPGWGPGWGLYGPYGYGPSSFDREVAVLIRDRRTGALLYEARAMNTGPGAGIDYLLSAMYRAALADFPQTNASPHRVSVEIAPGQ